MALYALKSQGEFASKVKTSGYGYNTKYFVTEWSKDNPRIWTSKTPPNKYRVGITGRKAEVVEMKAVELTALEEKPERTTPTVEITKQEQAIIGLAGRVDLDELTKEDRETVNTVLTICEIKKKKRVEAITTKLRAKLKKEEDRAAQITSLGGVVGKSVQDKIDKMKADLAKIEKTTMKELLKPSAEKKEVVKELLKDEELEAFKDIEERFSKLEL